MATERIHQWEIFLWAGVKEQNLSVMFLHLMITSFISPASKWKYVQYLRVPLSHATLSSLYTCQSGWQRDGPGAGGFLGCSPHKKSFLIYFPPNWKVHAHTWLNHHASTGDNPPRHAAETWGRENTPLSLMDSADVRGPPALRLAPTVQRGFIKFVILFIFTFLPHSHSFYFCFTHTDIFTLILSHILSHSSHSCFFVLLSTV